MVSSSVQVARFGGIYWNVEGLLSFVVGHSNGTEKNYRNERNNSNKMQWTELCTCLDFLLHVLGTQVVLGDFGREQEAIDVGASI